MSAKAYFLISVVREFCQCQDDYQEAVRELEAIPEVKSIEPIFGACDLIVKVEAPVRLISVADKILPKKWVKRLVILKVEPFRFNESSGVRACELLKARGPLTTERKGLTEQVV